MENTLQKFHTCLRRPQKERGEENERHRRKNLRGKNSKIKDVRLPIEKAHIIKGTHKNERERTQVMTHHSKVLEPGMRRSLKSFPKAKQCRTSPTQRIRIIMASDFSVAPENNKTVAPKILWNIIFNWELCTPSGCQSTVRTELRHLHLLPACPPPPGQFACLKLSQKAL